jgi:hypothetical protein
MLLDANKSNLFTSTGLHLLTLFPGEFLASGLVRLLNNDQQLGLVVYLNAGGGHMPCLYEIQLLEYLLPFPTLHISWT